MSEVGIETLGEQFGHYVKRALEGERIVITDHGHSVAMLISIEAGAVAKKASHLVESGAAKWHGGKPSGSKKRPLARGKSASAIVLEDRR